MGRIRDTILVVDDEEDIVSTLADYFMYNNYDVMTATNGMEAIEKAGKQPDLILLDINMPDVDGLEVCARIRDFVSCPILFLTARVEDSDKVKGFGMGGDDYIVKPFSLDELGARVAAHIRRERRRGGTPKVQLADKLAIDYTERRLFYDGEEIPFAKKEFDIIELLSGHPGQIFSKERIYELVWGYDSEGESSVVAEHIRRIRAKLAAVGIKPYVETVWGVGYKWARERNFSKESRSKRLLLHPCSSVSSLPCCCLCPYQAFVSGGSPDTIRNIRFNLAYPILK